MVNLVGMRGPLRIGIVGLAALLSFAGCGGTTTSTSTHSILDDVTASKVLKVGTYADDKPYSYYDANNNLVGFDIDIVNMLAKDLGATAQFTPVASGAARISGLVAGTYQLVAANFSLTAQRALSIGFTTPYMEAEEDLAVSTKFPDIKSYHDLTAANKCAIVTGSTQEVITKLAPTVQTIRFQDLASEDAALISGQADCVSEDVVHERDVISAHPGLLRLAGPTEFGPVSMGVPRDDLVWVNWLNQAILYHGMSNDIKAIWDKYFPGVAMPPIAPTY